ncbi:MAG TPA: tetratricopeptide repeat protein [Bacteroidales bacterium]|nr:tetratricopeptide repeat protein [Bacteroidales bacterium]
MTHYSLLIDRYLSGEMEADERKQFEQELKSNIRLAKEFRLSQDIDLMLADEAMIDFSRKLADVHRLRAKQRGVRFLLRRFHKRWYYAAASIVLVVITAGMLYFLFPSRFTNEKIFSMYYSSDQVMSVTRSGSNHLFDAVYKFQQKDYEGALVLFEEILSADTANIAVRFYSGVANIETGRYDEAISTFRAIIRHQDNLYIEHATWFLALTYLKNFQTDEAIEVFRILSLNNNSYYQQQAADILRKIQN